jgi:hypothetical protein
MNDAEQARRAVLDSAGEDEFGLWEILAAVRTALPGRDESALRTLAAGAVRELIGEGLVELRRGRALDNEATVPADAAVLEWEPAGDAPSYLSLRITSSGERAYYEQLREG